MIPVHILLVEDNPSDAKLVMRRLASASRVRCAVEHAEWLSTALMILKNRRVDLIFLDLSLPDSHGIDTVIAVRREAPNTPIIVLSGQEDLNVATRSMEAGADNFIVKRSELTSDELEREILYALERARRSATSKALMAKSLETLTLDSKPGSTPPPSISGMASEHVNKIDETVTQIRLYIQKNYPAIADDIEHILSNNDFYTAIQDLRTLLRMDKNVHTRRTVKISDRALEAIRAASEEAPRPADPEQELLEVLQSLGGEP